MAEKENKELEVTAVKEAAPKKTTTRKTTAKKAEGETVAKKTTAKKAAPKKADDGEEEISEELRILREIRDTLNAGGTITVKKPRTRKTTTKKAEGEEAPAKKTTTRKTATKKAETTDEKVEATPKKTTAAKTTTAKKAPAKKTATKVAEEAKTEEVKATKPAATKKAATKKGNKQRTKTTRLLEKYHAEIVPALLKKFEYKSIMQVPAMSKIVVNIGVGDATQDSKRLEEAVSELALITGQKPIITKAKKSIATFKLREGQAIGCKVTLRGVRMYEFFDKLISIALPRVRDFRGINRNSFDGHGNYTLGVKEQLIFPEIDYDKVGKIRGMDIVIVTTAHSDEEAYALLKEFGMPFAR